MLILYDVSWTLLPLKEQLIASEEEVEERGKNEWKRRRENEGYQSIWIIMKYE